MKHKQIDSAVFATVWNAASSLTSAARELGLPYLTASNRASILRRRGVELKNFRARDQRPESPSAKAAKVAYGERISFEAAGARFGVTREAVRQVYVKLYPGAPPPVGCVGDAWARGAVVELAKAGHLTDAAVAEEVGFSTGYVGAVRRRAGIVRDGAEKGAAFEAAIAAVRGGARAIDAAIDHGVSYNHLSDRCRALGIELNGSCVRSGRAVAAADLFERGGVTVTEAARRSRVSLAAVSGVLRRRRRAEGLREHG